MIKNIYYPSLLNSEHKHLFYILKEYTKNIGIVDGIYFILYDQNDEKKPEYLHRIPMNDLLKIKNDDSFLFWWQKTIMSFKSYESHNKKVYIIIHLNKENIKKKYNIDNDFIYIQPQKYKIKKDLTLFFKNLNYFYISFAINIILILYILLRLAWVI